ncbi:hypothetical protein [Massilia sp. Se16.2.3]|uniref:hypothetical protein n=1 Tax=Massilia sp. Se16.2.3 TaxID=2709303 RepID=UPI001602B43E|nr:hypothetical protein [Massilia sp. Se16.2.3]QNA98843.1 hypothetical protein G4G31_08400 [Massilia sp. Se16.2.3]
MLGNEPVEVLRQHGGAIGDGFEAAVLALDGGHADRTLACHDDETPLVRMARHVLHLALRAQDLVRIDRVDREAVADAGVLQFADILDVEREVGQRAAGALLQQLVDEGAQVALRGGQGGAVAGAGLLRRRVVGRLRAGLRAAEGETHAECRGAERVSIGQVLPMWVLHGC